MMMNQTHKDQKNKRSQINNNKIMIIQFKVMMNKLKFKTIMNNKSKLKIQISLISKTPKINIIKKIL